MCTPVLRQIKYWIRNRLQVSVKKCEKLGRRKCGGNIRFMCVKINSKPARSVKLLKTRHANANLFNYGFIPRWQESVIPSMKTGANTHVNNWLKLWYNVYQQTCGITLYKLLIHPVLTYAAPVWRNTSSSNYRQPQILQSKCLRVIDNTSQQDFGTRKTYCVSNVTFHAESKYAKKIFHHPQFLYNGLFNY